MIEILKNIDQTLLLLINGWHSPFLDSLMWAVSGKWIWIPLYLFVLFRIWQRTKRHWYWYVLGIAVTILLTDQLSVHCFKNVFMRYRPSHHALLKEQLHILHQYRGGLYGFVSSHAANTMGLAVFSLLAIKRRTYSVVILFWALLVSYSRIYLGVHYPFDILGGWILGGLVAIGTFKGTEWIRKKIIDAKNVS